MLDYAATSELKDWNISFGPYWCLDLYRSVLSKSCVLIFRNNFIAVSQVKCDVRKKTWKMAFKIMQLQITDDVVAYLNTQLFSQSLTISNITAYWTFVYQRLKGFNVIKYTQLFCYFVSSLPSKSKR
uniref:(northern house mosquito) hypothetical protein n=1 Tax=Culex pipiens TaxID=7175 RepID=A0A8D8BQB0_CULPI